MNRFFSIALAFGVVFSKLAPVVSQPGFTRADTLRGSLSPLRACFDVTFYDLHVRPDPETRTLTGRNRIHWRAVSSFQEFQLDLDARMQVTEFLFEGKTYPIRRDSNAFFVRLDTLQPEGTTGVWEVRYAGKPKESSTPPWDGGFVWGEDPKGAWRIAVACEGEGASLWWPLKDHLSDEPDSMAISIDAMHGYTAVSNGRLMAELPGEAWNTFVWKVNNPINSYNITLYVGKYTRLTDTYRRANNEPGDLIYYVYEGEQRKAAAHFKQVKPMLACFEQRFGEYPFWDDSYKLVSAPYWGMEHQSAIAYGNAFKNNAFGFDFIIVHESAHEWYGNSISVGDHADMWIHEAFATYAETMLLECTRDEATAQRYLTAQRASIKNEAPMVGPYGVNYSGWPDNDIYYKGAWMLHALRKAVGNDSLWHAAILGLSLHFKHSITDTRQVTAYLVGALGNNYYPFFNQYLHHAALPGLQVRDQSKGSRYAIDFWWKSDEPDFEAPVFLKTAEGVRRLDLSTNPSRLVWRDKKKQGWDLILEWGLYDVNEID